MLVVTRRVGQEIVMEVEGLEKPIRIVVKALKRNSMALAIDADQKVKINWRGELKQEEAVEGV